MKPDSRPQDKKNYRRTLKSTRGVSRYRIVPRRQLLHAEHQLGVTEGLGAFGALALRIKSLRLRQCGLEPRLSLRLGLVYRLRRRLVAELRAACLRPHRAGVRVLCGIADGVLELCNVRAAGSRRGRCHAQDKRGANDEGCGCFSHHAGSLATKRAIDIGFGWNIADIRRMLATALPMIVIHLARRRLPRIAARAPFLPLYAVVRFAAKPLGNRYVILSRFRR